MAMKYPQVFVQGIDISPVPLDPDGFPNLTFEIGDVNHSLSRFHSRFDLIHMRCVVGGLTDIKKTMEDLEMCLRPGGILLVIDGDLPFSEDRQGYVKMAKLEGDEDVSGVSEAGSWFMRIMWGMYLLLGITSRGNYDYRNV
jgi:trans-aconitate methyltransferase